MHRCGPGSSVGIVTQLRPGRSGDRIPVKARFSAPVQTGLAAHPASCKMGAGSFPGVKSSRGVTLIHHPLLLPWSRKSRAIPLLPLWAKRPVQGCNFPSVCPYADASIWTVYWIFVKLYKEVFNKETVSSKGKFRKNHRSQNPHFTYRSK